MKVAASILIGCVGLVSAGCSTSPVQVSSQSPSQSAQPRMAALPAAYPVETLVGRWGVASFREAKCEKRTEAMARVHCRNPYVITKGPTDGVMMHVADDAKRYELTFKRGPNGKTYLGFNAPPGHDQDREVVTFSKDRIVMRFVNPDINTRYGTYIYVRCGGSA